LATNVTTPELPYSAGCHQSKTADHLATHQLIHFAARRRVAGQLHKLLVIAVMAGVALCKFGRFEE